VCGLKIGARRNCRSDVKYLRSSISPINLLVCTVAREFYNASALLSILRMASNNNKKKKRLMPKLLSHTRPGGITKPASLSSRATRTLIREHHTLLKRLHAAQKDGDLNLERSVQAQIDAAGGLDKYQKASIQGQSKDRGGDSSKVLLEWLQPVLKTGKRSDGPESRKLRMLEVGCLKIDNACAKSGFFDVTRIDLHSQHSDILQQDFMERPLPSGKESRNETFDIISLSLVVNFVGDAVGRADMLKRTRDFLHPCKAEQLRGHFPGLFLVLPISCVINSRYMNEKLLEDMMQSLGFEMKEKKLSRKLVYYYWHYSGTIPEVITKKVFKKAEIRTGKDRNNFFISLK
jgi:25S rRNA (adenine2142-N1)-methyltransferase